VRTQPRVLRLFARLARPVRFRDVARELGITDQAAVDCLERLWRLQLVAPLGGRSRGFKWRREPGERVASLAFRLTHRGEERLAWWAAQKRRVEPSPS
jgi:DNA-binding IclR family transcriptional regulator